MPITYTHTFASKTTIDGSDLDEQFTTIKNKFAAGIVTGDLSASANIAASQLAVSTEHLVVRLFTTYELNGSAAWPAATTYVDYFPFPGTTSEGNWTVDAANWLCTDTGDGAGTLAVHFGGMTAGGGGFSSSATLVTATMSNAAGAQDPNDGTCTISTATVPFSTDARSFALASTGAGVGVMSNSKDIVAVTLKLSRTITA